MESGSHAALHRRKLHLHKSDTIGDEERFGVVSRPTSSIKEKYTKVNGQFAKEYMRVLLDGNGSELAEFYEGNVVDKEGKEEKSKFTRAPLRLLHKLTNASGNATLWEVDQDGNVLLELPTDASEGIKVDVPGGKAKIVIDGELELEAAGNTLKMSQNEIELKQGTTGPTVKLSSSGLTINGHNVVYHEFLDYFGTTHLVSTGIGFMSWQTAHNPGTIATFNAQKNIPGLMKSDSGIV
jgi:hypothetical protein